MATTDDALDAGSRAAVADWLAEVLARRIEPAAVNARFPGSGGWSSDTWLVDVDDHPVAVVRLQPQRAAMFPDYDLGHQVRCMRLVAEATTVPVPHVLGADLDGVRLGRPAFLMAHVDGRVPSDDTPTFAESGFIVDASSAEQRGFHTGLLDCLAGIHSLRADDPAVAAAVAKATSTGGVTSESGDATNSNHRQLDELHSIWQFDRGDRWPAIVDDTFARLAESVPQPSTDTLLWGDARPANVVVANDSLEPIAVLDWELATIGDPEHDLAWLAEMNWMRTVGADLQLPPGFLDDAAASEYYQELTGHRLSGNPWYRDFAALRVAVLMHRYLRTVSHAGRLPADHRIFSDSVASRRLEQLDQTRIANSSAP